MTASSDRLPPLLPAVLVCLGAYAHLKHGILTGPPRFIGESRLHAAGAVGGCVRPCIRSATSHHSPPGPLPATGGGRRIVHVARRVELYTGRTG